MSLQQAQAEGLCLRYPEPLGQHAQIAQETAVQMLLRAIQLSQHTPFAWGYIDKPNDGQLFLVFQTPQLPFPVDGLVYQDREQRYSIPAGNGRELEVWEIKFGFIPGVDQAAFRMRRRYRLQKGGHPQLILVHYSRGQATPIIPSLNQPARNYPLRPVNEPAIYVMGERQGQKVYPGAPGPVPIPPASERPGMNYPIPGMVVPGTAHAMLDQQNRNMDALERQAQRERATNMAPRPVGGRVVEEDDSADESETISTRTLALTRYGRNHAFMNEVFLYAAFGSKVATKSKPTSPHSTFVLSDLESKLAELTAEVEEIKAKSEARKQANTDASELRDVPMDGLAISEPITS